MKGIGKLSFLALATLFVACVGADQPYGRITESPLRAPTPSRIQFPPVSASPTRVAGSFTNPDGSVTGRGGAPTETGRPPTATARPPIETGRPPTDTGEPPTRTYTPASPTATPLPPMARTKIIVNVRAGPGAGFPLLGKLNKGELRPILGKSEDGKWWQIEFEGKRGWIVADFTEVHGGLSNVPVIAAAKLPTPTPVPTRLTLGRPRPTATPLPPMTISPGRLYFVVRQPDGSYTTAWMRPTERDKIFSDVMLGTAPGDFNPALSTNASPLDWSGRAGKLAYVVGSGTQNQLQTIDSNQNVVNLASHGAIVTPRWFADGEQLAYIGYDNNFLNQKIYLVRADGVGKRECFGARSGETLRGLAVSPANGEIVFVSNYSGGYELWKLDANCGAPVQLTRDNVDNTAPAFSPDGKTIAYVSNKAGPSIFEIYLMNADGTHVRRLVAGFSPAFSPDGDWLAFSANGAVYIMALNGAVLETLTPGYSPVWAEE